jgi:hypothetical protein
MTRGRGTAAILKKLKKRISKCAWELIGTGHNIYLTSINLLGEVERLKKELSVREEASLGLSTTLKSLTEANQAWEADSRQELVLCFMIS